MLIQGNGLVPDNLEFFVCIDVTFASSPIGYSQLFFTPKLFSGKSRVIKEARIPTICKEIYNGPQYWFILTDRDTKVHSLTVCTDESIQSVNGYSFPNLTAFQHTTDLFAT